MTSQTFSARRSRATTKPLCLTPEPVFYRCPRCGAVLLSALEAPAAAPFCCGEAAETCRQVPLEALPEGVRLDYKIVGGYNDNAVQVTWEISKADCRLRWLYLRTFTGGVFRTIPEKKRPPAVFALADEDAYAYCDKSPCLECVFRCKRGFAVYAMIEGIGLVRMPLDRMSPYWETRKNAQE